jgi:parallel beta-helix repeat protein
VTSAAELEAALSSAQGGDRIELAGGDYGEVRIDQDFTSDVTIVSADPDNPAIFHELHINGATHIVIDGILLDYINDPADPTYVKPFEVVNSSFVTVRNSVFDGDEIPSTTGTGEFGTGFGLFVNGSDNVTIENNEFFDFWKAVSVGDSSDIVVRANDVHSIRSDGFNFWDVHGLLVEDNYLHDFKKDTTTGDHPDMIQIWDVVDGEFSEDVIIRGNFLDAGDGDWTQSIFINGMGDETNFRKFLIEDNVIYNAHVHGISVLQGMDGLQILNNTLLYDSSAYDPSSPGSGAPRINLSDTLLNVTVEGNIVESTWNWDAMTTQPGWVVGDNLFVQHDDPSGANYVGELFVNALGQDPDLADLRALPDGLIVALGVGADMTRLDITLNAGPAH